MSVKERESGVASFGFELLLVNLELSPVSFSALIDAVRPTAKTVLYLHKHRKRSLVHTAALVAAIERAASEHCVLPSILSRHGMCPFSAKTLAAPHLRASFWMQSLGFNVFGQREFSEATGGKASRKATTLSPESDNLTEKLSQAGLVHSISCTNCKAAPARKYQIFCGNCGDALVPQYGDANKRDFSYFEFLQMNPTFDIDRAVLEAKYKQFEKRLHPDKHVHADQEYHDRLAKHRTKVIEAVSALKNPAKRALHLLAHHSPHSSEHVEDGPDADRVTDGDLLQEVFELNEALEMVTSREELDEFKRRVDALLEKDERDLSRRFREKNFDGIRSVIHRYQMHAKLQESIKNWSSPS
ncbi:UNVERIFIED_CONTAM: Fe-S protein assembly co-chaperone HscB protein [Hammondia hammondi]|eukprot:XP_008889058.1 Fe-S protein assembly co-chaperone HscB protein [Hammondia hammondi]